MTVTVSTALLIGLLADALQTAETDPEEFSVGIHIATHRSGFGDEPGNVDLIAVTSTDRFVVGHTFDVADGQITPSVWPVESAKAVQFICKGLLSARGKDHTVDLEVVEHVPDGEPAGDEKAAHPGYTVTLTETPALFDTDTEFQFHALHESNFPLANLRRILDGVGDDEKVAGEPGDGTETIWGARVLAPLTAIARRRKAPMHFYRRPGAWAQVVQIGATWIGAAMPVKPLPGEGRQEPSIEPLLTAPPTEGGEQ